MVGSSLKWNIPVPALWLAEAAVSHLESGAYKSRFSRCRDLQRRVKEKMWRKKKTRRRGRRKRRRKEKEKEDCLQLGVFCFPADKDKKTKKKVWGEKNKVFVWNCFYYRQRQTGQTGTRTERYITVQIICVKLNVAVKRSASVWKVSEHGGCHRGVSSPAKGLAAFTEGTQSWQPKSSADGDLELDVWSRIKAVDLVVDWVFKMSSELALGLVFRVLLPLSLTAGKFNSL